MYTIVAKECLLLDCDEYDHKSMSICDFSADIIEKNTVTATNVWTIFEYSVLHALYKAELTHLSTHETGASRSVHYYHNLFAELSAEKFINTVKKYELVCHRHVQGYR
jgi:hypothetical protein